MRLEYLAALQTAVMATYAVMIQTHITHWNVTGPDFFSVHAFLGERYEALLDEADALAERLRALGEQAMPDPTQLGVFLETVNRMKREDENYRQQLMRCHSWLDEVLAKAEKEATLTEGESVGANLIQSHRQSCQKALWMLRSAAPN